MSEKPDLSVVVVTYNRSRLLRRTISVLLPVLDQTRLTYEVIVADDCSDQEHLDEIRDLDGIRLVRTERNSGIGTNTNNGLRAARGDVILQLQDDWLYSGTAEALSSSAEFLRTHSEVGIVQLTKVGCDVGGYVVHSDKHDFILFRNDHVPWRRDCGVRPYSDQPHLKKADFARDIGPYREACPMGVCENDYKKRVANQSIWKVAQIEPEISWTHLGSASSFNVEGYRHPLVRSLRVFTGGFALLETWLRRLFIPLDHHAAKFLAR